MSTFQERVTKFVEKGLELGFLTMEDYEALMKVLETAGKMTTIHPELYAGLLRDTIEQLPKITEATRKEASSLRKMLESEGLEIHDVSKDESLWALKTIGSDASSCPIPIGLMKAAYISGMAFGEENPPIIVRDLVMVSNDEMGGREFKFYYQVQAEALIPVTCIRYIKENEEPDCIVIDGPLSASLLLRRIPYRRGLKQEVYQDMQKKAHQLIRVRDQLIEFCYKIGIPIFSVVKRCTSRHFLAWYGLKDVFPYTDQFSLHQILDYGQRTGSISISRAIEKQGAEPFARFNEIYGFYMKTSMNPLTPPIRVEYPQYLAGREDWIASYVLTTSLTTHEAEFDGLPKPLCLVHKDVKITKAIMKEIYRRVVTKMLDEGADIKLLGSFWGFSLE